MKKIPIQFLNKATNFLSKGGASYKRRNIKPPKIGLALSSGGARGLAHIGIMDVLEQHGIQVHAVSGSSMGAYIGAHICTGKNAQQMLEIASRVRDKNRLWELADPVIPPIRGFFKGDKMANFLRESIGDPDFEDLIHPLYAVTFDLDTQEKLVINTGNVAHAVHASCSIPGIVLPVDWNGHRCSDGGVVDPVPVSVLKEQSDVDIIIAVTLLPTLEDIRAGRTSPEEPEDRTLKSKMLRTFNRNTNLFANGNTVDTLRRSVRAAQSQIAHLSCEAADIVMKPDAYNLPWHSFDAMDEIVEAGRVSAREVLPELQAAIDRFITNQHLPTHH